MTKEELKKETVIVGELPVQPVRTEVHGDTEYNYVTIQEALLKILENQEVLLKRLS